MKKTILKRGSVGPSVLQVQARLRASGYSVPLSGALDDVTTAAVSDFQASHLDSKGRPLGVDGEVSVGGLFTWWALQHPSKRKQAQPKVPASKLEAARLADGLPDPARTLLWLACNEIGVKEEPDGSNGGPRVDVYTDKWRVPWCALFVSYVLRQALKRDAFPPHRGLASVQKIAAWAKAREGAFFETFHDPGDVFLMLHEGGDSVDAGRGHTGFVLALDGDSILTVEGNCANAVRCRRRKLSTIAGYVNALGVA